MPRLRYALLGVPDARCADHRGRRGDADPRPGRRDRRARRHPARPGSGRALRVEGAEPCLARHRALRADRPAALEGSPAHLSHQHRGIRRDDGDTRNRRASQLFPLRRLPSRQSGLGPHRPRGDRSRTGGLGLRGADRVRELLVARGGQPLGGGLAIRRERRQDARALASHARRDTRARLESVLESAPEALRQAERGRLS